MTSWSFQYFQQTFEGPICVDIQLNVHGQADVCRCEIMNSYYRPLLMTLDLSSSIAIIYKG